MDAGGTTWMGLSMPILAILAAGICALLFGYWSWVRAWIVSEQHAPFRQLGFRKWVIGYAAVSHMPDKAMVHVKRHFVSLVAFVVLMLVFVAMIWIDVAR
jgi:hypothetical protein